jgi:hypothetical protein
MLEVSDTLKQKFMKVKVTFHYTAEDSKIKVLKQKNIENIKRIIFQDLYYMLTFIILCRAAISAELSDTPCTVLVNQDNPTAIVQDYTRGFFRSTQAEIFIYKLFTEIQTQEIK